MDRYSLGIGGAIGAVVAGILEWTVEWVDILMAIATLVWRLEDIIPLMDHEIVRTITLVVFVLSAAVTIRRAWRD